MIQKILVANRGKLPSGSCGPAGKWIFSRWLFFPMPTVAPCMSVMRMKPITSVLPLPTKVTWISTRSSRLAKKSGSDAIHPGYGFLSENADFSDRCKKEGIIFIGPSGDSIRKMGDKITARQTMIKAGVPVVPGTTEPITDETKAVEVIREIGLPVMIKASAGGGGKGMRLVKEESQILGSIRAARSEACLHSATMPFISKSISNRLTTSSSRSLPITMATRSIFLNGNVRSRGGTRKLSKKHLHYPDAKSKGRDG